MENFAATDGRNRQKPLPGSFKQSEGERFPVLALSIFQVLFLSAFQALPDHFAL
jgi:hypothetical protein